MSRSPSGAPELAWDVERIRKDFPILQQEVHGKPLVYLDNAATTQKPQLVLDALQRYYTTDNANVHRGVHLLSERATEAYEIARTRVQHGLHAKHAHEIIFVRGTTEGINLVAQTFGRRVVGSGDEVLITALEHHSNIVPWQMLCEERDAALRVVPIDEAGEVDLEAYDQLLTARTKLVAIAHVSNALGTVVPVGRMIDAAHRRGVPVLVDGAQAVAHMRVDVQSLGCDFYVFSGHKVYGPTGIGALYGKYEHLAAMPPFNGGGEMIQEVSQDRITYGEPPYRFEAGTPAIVQAIGLGAAIDYVNSVGKPRIRALENALVKYAHERLTQINSLRIIGQAPGKGPIVSFELKGAHPHDVATIIDRSGVAVRAGTHCTMPLLARFGVTATCRASFAMYNTRDEIDALAASLIKAQEFFG
ncbi:MAG TPA: cysteine desulfurase [Candidatus Methylomirabilis sp.]|nr:cysteine desulfurase [Candidatus Methylomirabilis sp.]